MNHTFYSVTGKQGSGKTAFLKLLLEKAISGGIDVGGFLQKRGDVRDEIAYAYDLTRARTGESVRVATRQSNRKFVFESQAFRTALAWVKEDILAAQLIVIDELGLLESEDNGHAAVFPLLLHAPPEITICFSLRKDKASEWYERLAIPIPQRFDLDTGGCDQEAFIERILEVSTFHPPYPSASRGE